MTRFPVPLPRRGAVIVRSAGYGPRPMFGMGGGQAPPEFFSMHPKPANRVAYIKQVIAEEFPQGVPDGLEQ